MDQFFQIEQASAATVLFNHGKEEVSDERPELSWWEKTKEYFTELMMQKRGREVPENSTLTLAIQEVLD